ncbi:MAG: hypothetical protein ACPLRZ_11570 [Thermovenabulum sp.]|uniref:hypothetical protein n=1 Tax=Thermovenabulum sp. TaxID=3100335 RepID=UPI003C7C55C1
MAKLNPIQRLPCGIYIDLRYNECCIRVCPKEEVRANPNKVEECQYWIKEAEKENKEIQKEQKKRKKTKNKTKQEEYIQEMLII